MKAVIPSTFGAEQTLLAYVFIVLLTDVAMILRGIPTIFTAITRHAKTGYLAVIAGLAA